MDALLLVAALIAPESAPQGKARIATVKCDPGFVRMALPETLGRRSRDTPRLPRDPDPARRLDCFRLVHA